MDENLVEASGSDVLEVTRPATSAERLQEMVEASFGANRALRVRCDLRLYDPKSGQHRWWPDAGWTIDLHASVEKGEQLRTLMGQLFERLVDEGLAKVSERLK